MIIADYFKGVGKLIIIGILVLLAGIFFFVFNMLYAAAVFVFAIAAIIFIPYFVGRPDSPEKKNSYSLKKVK
ncbi:MAG: hypothetical protein V1839_02980 [archaeon]